MQASTFTYLERLSLMPTLARHSCVHSTAHTFYVMKSKSIECAVACLLNVMRQMTIARYLILLAVFLVFASVGRAQTEQQVSVQKLDTRTVSIYAGLGGPEFIALGVQYQNNSKFALGVKLDVVLIKGGGDIPLLGAGGGMKGSCFFSRAGEGTFLSINVVNIEASYLAVLDGDGTLVESTIGHDSIEGQGIGILWSIGTALRAYEGGRPSISLAAKIGLHVDL